MEHFGRSIVSIKTIIYKDGYKSTCKTCCKIYKSDYYKTVEGLLSVIYNGQQGRSKKRKYAPPNYSLKEFKDWLVSQKVFHELYADWVKSGYQKMMRPSADRLNDYKSYTFTNLRWVTWQENFDKAKDDIITGINNKNSKAINQYSLGGVFIKEYHSTIEASRQTNINRSNITQCCLGKRKTASSFKWSFVLCL